MHTRSRTLALGGALGLAGLVAGGVLAASLSANAAGTGSGTASYGGAGSSPSTGHANGNTDPTKPMRNDEKLLTGTTRSKVLAVVKAKYPDATVQRAETDSDGVYEAHIVDNGTPLTVQVGKDFTITGTQGGPGGPGGPSGPSRPGGPAGQPGAAPGA